MSPRHWLPIGLAVHQRPARLQGGAFHGVAPPAAIAQPGIPFAIRRGLRLQDAARLQAIPGFGLEIGGLGGRIVAGQCRGCRDQRGEEERVSDHASLMPVARCIHAECLTP
ncbi:hypothetical protein [Sandarakinorhabdus limnophila]|uniref:hypothetical protein n=1 Tax=Sandarakinorhabdus limnophila TaxID=210512 RepID=UPI003137E109